MDRKEFEKIYNSGIDATYDIFTILEKQIEELFRVVEIQSKKIEELEKKLSKDSNNSSKPPSTDGFKKSKRELSNREKSNKKKGGQEGHKGSNLKMVKKPDKIITKKIKACSNCRNKFKREDITVRKRQEFELPPLKIEVTEYQAEEGLCPCCGKTTAAKFPDHITKATQYGFRLKSLLVYLNQYQLVPYKRTVEIINDLFGYTFSQGSLYNAIATFYHKLEKPEQEIKDILFKSKVVHFDESGGYCDKIREWFHVASNQICTYIGFHFNRGKKAINDFNILPKFIGYAVHDFYSSYLKYKCIHILCNAHLLRELKFQHQIVKQYWAKELSDLIKRAKKLVDKAKIRGTSQSLSPATILKIETEFEKIVKKGLKKNPRNKGTPGKRGKVPQTDTRNLLERLRDWQDSYLKFMRDFDIPFDNNQAERDFRMVKVQQKISGCFRSKTGAKYFCRIRGYISTAIKNKKNVMDALYEALEDRPFIPNFAK